MGFAVYNIKKGKSSSGGMGNHIDRIEGMEHTYENADSSRRHLNKKFKVYADRHKMKLSDAINDRIKEGYKSKAKIRNNAVKYLMHVFTSGQEDMQRIQKEGRFEEWIRANYEFLAETYGEKNIVRFTLHMDEMTPHLHAVTVPLTDDGRLSAREIMGNKSKLQAYQDIYAEKMSKFGLERGLRNTGISHQNTQEFYKKIKSNEHHLTEEQVKDLVPNVVKYGVEFKTIDEVKTKENVKRIYSNLSTALQHNESELKQKTEALQYQSKKLDELQKENKALKRTLTMIAQDEEKRNEYIEYKADELMRSVGVQIQREIQQQQLIFGQDKFDEICNNTFAKCGHTTYEYELFRASKEFDKILNTANERVQYLQKLEEERERQRQQNQQNRGFRMR